MLKLNEVTYQALGVGNTLMVVTDEGNVIIDTSLATSARGHRDRLRAIDDGPIRYIILTHAHGDHTGGVGLWREQGTEVIAQQRHVEFVHYPHRLRGALGSRNSSQFPFLFGGATLPFADADAPVDNDGGEGLATTLFDQHLPLELGGLTFQLVHTPGETATR